MHIGRGAEHLDEVDVSLKSDALGRLEMFGPQPHLQNRSRHERAVAGLSSSIPPTDSRPPGMTLALRKFMRRRANKAGDEDIVGVLVEIDRRADLLDTTRPQHDDPVGHGHGFGLVVGHIDHGVAQYLVELQKLHAHLYAQLRIEIAERLIEQKHLRIAHNARPMATRWR